MAKRQTIKNIKRVSCRFDMDVPEERRAWQILQGSYQKPPDSLMEKLHPLSDKECMETVHDIRKNYRLPQGGRTVGEMIAEARQKSGAEQLKGHDIMALERFDPEVRHMVVFEVLSGDSFAGDKGDRMRLFLTDAGYRKFQDRQETGEIKIEDHMKVTPDGHLYHDHSRDSEHTR